MSENAKKIILYFSLIILGTYFLVAGLIKIQSFLVPIAIAALLAMVLLPVVSKLTQWKVPRGLAILIADIALLGLCVGLILVVAAQVETLADQWPQLKENIQPKIEKVQTFIADQTGITKQEQTQQVKEAFNSRDGKSIASRLSSFFPGLVSSLGNFLLVFIYIFFFIYYKDKFRNSILNFIPDEKRHKGENILSSFSKVSQQYLFGRFILILFLAIIYTIGLFIVGVKYALFISILAAILTIIPYIGNVIGIAFALIMSVMTGGSMGSIIGVLIVFTIAQFFESYILEPYVVGHKVEINPVATIIGVVVGNMIWGLPGMIIAIPVMGILKAIFDHVPVLNPLGYVLDENDISGGSSAIDKIKKKIAALFRKD